MLDRLLQLMAEGGMHSYKDLTEHLSITEPLLETMLNDLARLGYLRSLSPGCAGHCAACPETSDQLQSRSTGGDRPKSNEGLAEGSDRSSCPLGGCLLAGSRKLWALTDKGARAVNQHST